MLSEFKAVRQAEKTVVRRWYSDDYFDLIVWFAPDMASKDIPCGFQLCYHDDAETRALTYNNGVYSHDTVDEGGKWNETPILVSGGNFPKDRVLSEFESRSAQLDPPICSYIIQKIQSYPVDAAPAPQRE